MAGVADEVVVVDTGSRDRSVAIARAHGARVHHREWTGDFAAARNAALDRARGRWILYIDADERLADASRAAVRPRLEEAPEVALRVLLSPGEGWTPYREWRLWRNDPRIRFAGVIHEKVLPGIRRVAREDGLRAGVCDVLLEHAGYAGDQAHKHRRNLPLLRRQLEREPRDVFSWRHLGVVLGALGEPDGAERALWRAVELARDGAEEMPHGSLAFAELVRLRHERGLEVGELLAEGRARYPGNWLLVWIGARLDIARGDWAAALSELDRLAAVDPATLPDGGVAYDGRIFGAWAQTSRGLCLLQLGRPAEAAEAYAAAARAEPGDPGHAVRLRLARARAGAR